MQYLFVAIEKTKRVYFFDDWEEDTYNEFWLHNPQTNVSIVTDNHRSPPKIRIIKPGKNLTSMYLEEIVTQPERYKDRIKEQWKSRGHKEDFAERIAERSMPPVQWYAYVDLDEAACRGIEELYQQMQKKKQELRVAVAEVFKQCENYDEKILFKKVMKG